MRGIEILNYPNILILFIQLCMWILTNSACLAYITLIFIPNLVYIAVRFMYGHTHIDNWEELSELYLAMGIFAMVLVNKEWFYKKVIAKNISSQTSTF